MTEELKQGAGREDAEAGVNPKKGMEYVPGNGQAANSDQITRDYFDAMLLVYRHIGAAIPNSETTVLGKPVSTPIMSSALALLERMREGGSAEFAKGMARAGGVLWTGWIDMDAFRAVCDTGVAAVCGIKPFADNDRVYDAIEKAAGAGAIACCMDIDHCFDDAGRDCGFVFGQLAHKTEEELRGYAAAAAAKGIPFLLKGILSTEDALLAKELGMGGIVVSHHKGIWSYAAPPAMVLPEIRAAVGEDYPVFADCGIKNGVDAFKALAVGADAVGVARELMGAFAKKGADGVYDRLMFLNDELLGTMAKTRCATVSEIGPGAIRMRTGW